MSWTRIDLARRKVAAISFLSNISVETESHGGQYDCLKGTQVLQEFRARRNQRVTWLKNRDSKGTDIKVNRKPDRNQRKSFEDHVGLYHEDFDADNETDDELQVEPMKENRTRLKGSSLKIRCRALHRCAANSASVGGQLSGSSTLAVPEQQQQQLQQHQSVQQKWSTSSEMADSVCNNSSSNQAETSIEPVENPAIQKRSSRRKRLLTVLSDEMKIDSRSVMTESSESLYHSSSLLPKAVSSRLRKISGTSENSSSSMKETRIFCGILDLFHHRKQIHGEERMVLVTPNRRLPFAVFSVLPLQKCSSSLSGKMSVRGEHMGLKRQNASSTRPLSAITDVAPDGSIIDLNNHYHLLDSTIKLDENLETSYGHLLRATVWITSENDKSETKNSSEGFEWSDEGELASPDELIQRYSPYWLEGWLIAGKHRTFLPNTAYLTSIIEYVRPMDLKKELNLKFREQFPHLNITLTKLRSIKKELKVIALQECGLDLLTLSLSYAYFERLVLRTKVNKWNRKCLAGAALILAAKLNDVKGNSLTLLFEKIETTLRLSRKELLNAEFFVLVSLEFSLHMPTWHIYPHYQRLLYEV